MSKRIITDIILYFILGIFIAENSIQSQEVKVANYQYISPIPGSKYIMPQSNIVIRHGDLIQVESLQNLSIQVEGSIYKPEKPYKWCLLFASGRKIKKQNWNL